jgi:protein tyrosine phosphatase (PTP) superfamily phosphohydrolase (DUF442 family)
MADFDWVTSRIAVGGSIDSLYDARRIAAAGITHVLNVRTDQDEVPLVHKAGMTYSSNPSKKKDEAVKPPGWFKSSFDIIFGCLADPGTKILVHCENGENPSRYRHQQENRGRHHHRRTSQGHHGLERRR